jgi:deazaflavin-dependent oxidoreductase (nitroreductase family)
MAAPRRSKAVELFWKIHPRLYRWSGGRIGGKIGSMPVLLLDSVGRKSGAIRTNALTYLPKGNSYVVIASFLGEPRHPAWFLNLRSTPDAEIQIGSKRLRIRAREALGAERQALWSEIVGKFPDYAEYQSRTDREIPVVILDRG